MVFFIFKLTIVWELRRLIDTPTKMEKQSPHSNQCSIERLHETASDWISEQFYIQNLNQKHIDIRRFWRYFLKLVCARLVFPFNWIRNYQIHLSDPVQKEMAVNVITQSNPLNIFIANIDVNNRLSFHAALHIIDPRTNPKVTKKNRCQRICISINNTLTKRI